MHLTRERIPVFLRALAAQMLALLLVFLGAALASVFVEISFPPLALALVEGALAAWISRWLLLPRWWLVIQLAFVPLILLALALAVDPAWYFSAFVLLVLVFGAVHASRVPLFFSGEAAIEQLLTRISGGQAMNFLDAGCGVGSVLAHFSRARPAIQCAGIESAPLPWLVAFLRGALARPRFRVRYGSFWDLPFEQWDVVYAYLSPAAMPRLWVKARLEMRAGTVLISNSFPVPDITPSETVPWGKASTQALFIYRI